MRRRLLNTVVKPSSSGTERAVVENDKTTPRDSAKVTGSRAAAGVVTTLEGVAAAEAETDGGIKWQTVVQGGKPLVKHFETMTRCQTTIEAEDVMG